MHRIILKLTLKQRRKIFKLTGQNIQFLEVEVCPECRDKFGYYNQVPMYAYGFNQENPPMNPRPRPRQMPPRHRYNQPPQNWDNPEFDNDEFEAQNFNEPIPQYNPYENIPRQPQRQKFQNPTPKSKRTPPFNPMKISPNPRYPENPNDSASFNSSDLSEQDQDDEE